MLKTIAIAGLLMVGLSLTTVSASHSEDNHKTEHTTGITAEELVRGLKSAARTIEQEIPKIGSAIGETFKKFTEKHPDKKPRQGTSKDKK